MLYVDEKTVVYKRLRVKTASFNEKFDETYLTGDARAMHVHDSSLEEQVRRARSDDGRL